MEVEGTTGKRKACLNTPVFDAPIFGGNRRQFRIICNTDGRRQD